MKRKKYFIVILLVIISLSINSCALDDDIILDENDPSAIFLGTWSVSDNETKLNYEVVIQRNPSNSTEVLLQNFASSGSSATALVVGKTLTVTSQIIGSNWTVTGTGIYKNSSRIDFDYSLIVGGSTEKRFAIYTR